MKHKGKALQAALKMILLALLGVLAVVIIGILAKYVGVFVAAVSGVLLGVWLLFAGFCLWFFRDPDAVVPADPKAIVSPAYGKVDVIDEKDEPVFMGAKCRRISIFLSVVEVHVQKAPVAGRVGYLKHNPGDFMSALRTECSEHNENVLIGFESSERPGEKVAVRLIAGVLARRILPWLTVGDTVARGERTSLIQFGSRVDLYLPPGAVVQVKLGDRVKAGETVIATRG